MSEASTSMPGPKMPANRKNPRWGALAVEVPAVVVLFVMALHVVVNALMRRFFRAPVDHTLELVQYWYLPVVALLGMVAAQARGQHIAADLIYRRLPRIAQRIFTIMGTILCIILAVGFAWYGYQEATHSMDTRRTAGVTGLPIWPVYFLVPIVFATLTVQFLIMLVRGKEFDFVEDTEDLIEDEIEEDLKVTAKNMTAHSVSSTTNEAR